MKIIKNLIIILIAGSLAVIVFIYSAFNETTWGGWKPPSTELKLSGGQSSWKKNIEQDYNCKIDFIGLDNAFREDSVLYITIEYKENSILKRDLNDAIESITEKIASSFLASSKMKSKQSYISIDYSYIHNYSNDTVKNNIPARRTCTYSVKNKKSIPTIQKLIIPKFNFFYFDASKNDLFYDRLGDGAWSYIENASHNDSVLKRNVIQHNQKFRKLDSCTSYTTRFPHAIQLKGGFMHSYHQFIFHEDHCISVRITYKCFPGKKDLNKKDFCRKVTEISPGRLKYSSQQKLDLADILRESNYDYQGKLHGVAVIFKVDTLKNPYVITYETLLDDFKYYRTSQTE